jgi:hypothetical protein
MRFFPLMIDVAAELTSKGAIVLMPYKVVPPDEQSGPAKAALDQLHRDKIDQSVSVVVVTDSTGYFGDSTRGEISHAIRTGKPVTLCQRTADTSGLGQQRAAETKGSATTNWENSVFTADPYVLDIALSDADECREYFTQEAVEWADALRIAAFRDAQDDAAGGCRAVFRLAQDLLQEMPSPLAQALSGVPLELPEGPWPHWGRTDHPINWPDLIDADPEHLTWNHGMLAANMGAGADGIAAAYRLLAAHALNPRIDVWLWIEDDARISVEPLSLYADRHMNPALTRQIDDILVDSGRPRERLRYDEDSGLQYSDEYEYWLLDA